ncbi:MAG TPA: hypothetical protein VGD98_01125 [Ktedonobacteraceae bacterium]
MTTSESNEDTWLEQYKRLSTLVEYLVYRYRRPQWRGQEEEIVADITQEAVSRYLERARKAELGEATPIQNPLSMMIAIARNHLYDLLRRKLQTEYHPGEALAFLPLGQESGYNAYIEAKAIDNVYQEWLFRVIADRIARFPRKQRQALLIDLANSSMFEDEPGRLQIELLALGINLQDYRQPIPTEAAARARHTSLLFYARKRLAMSVLLWERKTSESDL